MDRKASLNFEERFELDEYIKSNNSTWKHNKLREIPIPKKDGSTRILKVPTIADRAWQCLAKFALEPAHEATFHARSYGFRTGRSAHDAQVVLDRISQFLAERGMNVSAKKTKITATTDGFDFLGWHFKVQKNGKFRSTPSAENFKTFRKKVKAIVNNSNYGAKVKAEKLAPVVRGWRNYHRHCKMNGSRNSLWHINNRALKVFNKETKQDRYSSLIQSVERTSDPIENPLKGSCEKPAMVRSRKPSCEARESPSVLRRGGCQK